jgi:hypothetical protein
MLIDRDARHAESRRVRTPHAARGLSMSRMRKEDSPHCAAC